MPEMAAKYPSLNGSRVFITGGATGIGAALVKAFRDQGAAVGFVDIAQTEGEALARDQKAWFRRCDVTDSDDLQAAVRVFADAVGGLDILINNVANDTRQDLGELSAADWRANLAVNLDPVFAATQAATSLLKASGGGAIINFSSLNVLLAPADLPAYTTAKSAILGFTKSTARALGEDRIRVNAIVPGWVETERQKALWLNEAAKAEWLAQCALKDPLLPEHVADMVLFLSSDAARMVTGQAFVIDAGRT